MSDQTPVNKASSDDAWIERPANGKRIVWALAIVSLVLFVADGLYHKHPYFGIEEMFGFYGVYGFIACAVLVFGAKFMRRLLMRDEAYYTKQKDDA